jgi:hypothetical protein
MAKTPNHPCPICTADLQALGVEHCSSTTCSWVLCTCGALVAAQGLWIAPARPNTTTQA